MLTPKVLCALAAVAAILVGCAGPLSSGSGSLSITITDNVSSRTLVPALSMTPGSYAVSGKGPNGAKFSQTVDATTGSASTSVDSLVFGSWDVTVDALNAGGTPIGQGSAPEVIVHTGETTDVTIPVVALGGKGTFSVQASWPDGKVETPYLNFTITPSSGEAISVSEAASEATAWGYTNSDLTNGYYTVSLQLSDDGGRSGGVGPVVAGAAETLRIVKGQTTTWSISFENINSPGGQVATSITPDLSDPLVVAISRSSTAFTDEARLNFSASQSGYAGTARYSWYVNGGTPPENSVTNGSLMSLLPGDVSAGYNRVDAIATGGSQAGSTSFSFQWKGSLESAPNSPSTNWAYYNTTDGIPYLWDSSAEEWQPFSDVPVHVADLVDEATFKAAYPSDALGYDYPMDGPESANKGAPGFGSTSFYSNVTGSDPRKYTALRIVPQTLLGLDSLPLSDIASIAFWSKQDNVDTESWYVRIYTLPESGASGWYKTRINSVKPIMSNAGWTLNSTTPSANTDYLIQFNKITDGDKSYAEQHPSPAVDLAEVTARSGDYAHGGENIEFIDIAAGDDSTANVVKSYLDGVVITTTDGKAIILDLGD